MSRPVDPRDFADADRAGEPENLVRYLREVSVLEQMKAMNEYVEQVLDVRAGHRVVDVGCGAGDDVRRLSELVGPRGYVVGVDAATMVEAARGLGNPPNVEFVVADAHSLPFDDASFDRYRAHRVYMHLRDPASALSEAARVLRPGGAAVVSEPDWGTLALDADDRDLTHTVLQSIQDAMQEPWIGRRLPRLFREAGFVDVQMAPQFGFLPNYETAHRMLLEEATDRLIRTSTYPATRVAAWLDHLADRDRRGDFFFGCLTVVVRGYRPKKQVLRSLVSRVR